MIGASLFLDDYLKKTEYVPPAQFAYSWRMVKVFKCNWYGV